MQRGHWDFRTPHTHFVKLICDALAEGIFFRITADILRFALKKKTSICSCTLQCSVFMCSFYRYLQSLQSAVGQ